METKSIKFWDLVKLIHPDWNPDITSPEEKMGQATENKDDGEKLYKLAVKWGLIKDDLIKDFDIEYSICAGYSIEIDNKINGIVVDTEKIQNGLKIIVYHNNKFSLYIRKNNYDQDKDFYITGIADTQKYMEADLKYLQTEYGQKQQSGEVKHREYDPPEKRI